MLRWRTVLPAAMLLATLGAGIAFAGVDDQIKARQDEMKANGKALETLVAIMRGAQPYDPAVVKASLDAMTAAKAAADAAHAWDASARTGSIPTRALPAVWDNPTGFAADMKGFEDAIAQLAATTDETGFKAAFPAVGKACGACHADFRAAGN